MVDLSDRLSQIKRMVDAGQYFTINRARQYGKTTILQALDAFLKTDYVVINIDFQLLSASKFRNENAFSIAFAKKFLKTAESNKALDTSVLSQLKTAKSWSFRNFLDERVAGGEDFPGKSSAWTSDGFLAAVRILIAEPNTLFDSLIHRLVDYPELDRKN